jgi:Outer membrane receptor proteins, mostly Fe transport
MEFGKKKDGSNQQNSNFASENDFFSANQFYIHMKMRLSLVLLSFFISYSSFSAVTVKGKVIDKMSNKPLEYATIRACSLPDSTFVIGCITEPKGNFSMELENGKYLLEFQYMGFKVQNKNLTIDGSKNVIDIGKVYLVPDEHLLNEVEVVAEISTYEMTLDKRVFNVGKDVSSTAGNAIEVLENIPAVSVDIEGNVSLRGDEGVRILIDGKESGLSGMSTQDALRTVQADMIERVEVITNPSVRYDAEGSAGIINIVLKKEKRRGFNGTVNLRGGYPWQYGLGVSTNYRMNKFNFFASYNYNNRQNIGGGRTQSKRFEDVISSDTSFLQLTDQVTNRTMKRQGHNIRFGTDYYITDKDILSLAFVYRYANNTSNPIVKYSDIYPLLDSSSYDVREEKWKEDDPVYEVTMDYDKTFERKGQSLKANVRYFHNAELSSSDIVEKLYSSTAMTQVISSLSQRTMADESQDNFQATIDYVHPFSKKAVWEIGGKYTLRDITSISLVEDNANGIWSPLSDYCYDFDYNEQVGALYTSLGNDWGRWSGQIGVRAEMTNIYTNMKNYDGNGSDSINGGKPYLDFFPSAHINYSFSEHDQLQISYTRRIRRPGYWQLSPFRSYNDNRNIRTGNPALKPVYMDSYEVGYIHFLDKASFTFTTFYRHGENTFRRYTYLVDDIYYTMPINFGTSNDFGVEAVAQGQMLKWWNLNGNINFFRSFSNGKIGLQDYTTDSYMYFGRLMSKFSFKKIFDLQLTAHYMGPRVDPLGKSDSEWWMDLAVSKDVFKGNGTFTLNVRDLFGTRGRAGESWGDNFWQYSTNTWNKTTVSLNFNYRINQQAGKRDRNRHNEENSTEESGGEYESEM